MTSSSPLGQAVYGVVGVGEIAAAIVSGLMRHDGPIHVILSPRGAAMSSALAAQHQNISVASDNQAVVDQSDVVLICVRPQDAESVLRELKFRAGQTVISAVAGWRLARLRPLVTPAVVCRAIPLPALSEAVGKTPICPPVDVARALFDRFGGATEVEDEAQVDAFSAATATIAAYIDYLATIADWLSGHSVDRNTAEIYVASAFATLDLMPSEERPLRDLARHYATPGGINEAFARILATAGLPEAARDGLDRILARLTDET